jgi:hypothetical protein
MTQYIALMALRVLLAERHNQDQRTLYVALSDAYPTRLMHLSRHHYNHYVG